jgi:hypothetical protein
MAEKYRLSKTVLNKNELERVVDTEFSTFSQPTLDESNDTVQELFRLYNALYLEIPFEGPQSHTYLIGESSKLIQVAQDTLDIQPLLDEISDLRQRLLDADQALLLLESQMSNGGI